MSISRAKVFTVLMIVSLFGANVAVLSQGKRLTTREAQHHIGHQGTVCGMVRSERYLPKMRGSPTYLDLDQAYPDQRFSVVIWGMNRTRFKHPETYRDHSICITGRIGTDRGLPEMIISDPGQLSVNTP